MTSQTQKMTRNDRKMQPFFDLMDDYTGIYLCGLEDGIFLCGKTPISMEKHDVSEFF